jgi:uncharacterized membrane protein
VADALARTVSQTLGNMGYRPPQSAYTLEERRYPRQHEEDTVKNLAFAFGLLILAVGAVGVLAPSGLVWAAHYVLTPGSFYIIAAVRVVFGLVLISVASGSRAPRTLRVLGYVIVIAGMATALTGLVAMDRARTVIEWWLQHGSRVIRLAGLAVLALGGFIAYACAPARRAA